MKKILVGVAVLAVALVIFGSGFVFAQYQTVAASSDVSAWMAPNGTPQPSGSGGMLGRGGRGSFGSMHTYIEQALATKLGLTEAQIEAQQAAGKSLSQIALENGIAQADVTAVLTEVHQTAFAQAVTDGVLTQAQADAMLTQMTAQGFDFAGPAGMMGRGGRDGFGLVHNYVEQALAAKLGLTEAQIEEQQAAGKSLSQIALENGIAQADVTTVLTEVHQTALAQAVTAGVLTQAQADALLTQMTAQGFEATRSAGMMGRGGHGGGHGGMQGGWGAQQTQSATPTPAP